MAALFFLCVLGPAVAGATEPQSLPAAPTTAPASEAPAPAPPPSEAVRLYDEGLRQFRAGAYDQAIASLLAAYEQAPIPMLLYDLGQAYRLARDCVRARDSYQRFLATGPTGRARALAEARVGELGQCDPRDAEVKASPPATSGVDAGASGPDSRPAHALPAVATDRGAPSALDPRVGGVTNGHPGAEQRLREPLPPPDDDGRRTRRRVAVVSSVAVIVLGAGSGYFGWHATRMSEEVSAGFTPGGTWDDVRDADRTGRWDERWALVTGVGALVAAGVAAWAFWK